MEYAVIVGTIAKTDYTTDLELYNDTDRIYDEDTIYSLMDKRIIQDILNDIKNTYYDRANCLLTEYLDFDIDYDAVYRAIISRIEKDQLKIIDVYFNTDSEDTLEFAAHVSVDLEPYRIEE